MTLEQKKKVEDYVNGVIALKLPVTYKEMGVNGAKESGAQGEAHLQAARLLDRA